MKSKKKKNKFAMSTTRIIAFGFLLTIIAGALLLALPISAADGKATPFVDALFTSTTSVCVTGLVVKNTFEHWSEFGQAVILLLIQCGGLGIVTFTTLFMVILRRRVTLKDRLILQDAYNLHTLKGLVKFSKRIMIGTLIVESIGAFFYSFTFVPEFGWGKGIWVSVFNSVSAFCNAGIDIIGPASLSPYLTNVNVNFVTMLLIISGGIGFIVWWDLLDAIKEVIRGRRPLGRLFDKLSLHSKVVITTTVVLIVSGAVFILAIEYNNPDTIGNLNFGQKVMASFFQSITTRTAGFMTFSQKSMRDASALICIIFMFIGGSPVGTAGGVKTSTIALIFISVMAAVRGSEHGTAFKRTLPSRTTKKALAVVVISMMVVILNTILLSQLSGGEFIDVFFETASAIGTAGLSRDFTGTLNLAGKLIIIVSMYLGRIGPISMAIAFGFKQSKYGLASYAREDITVG